MITPAALREARKKAGMTQLEAAVKAGVSYQCYRLWEAGGTKPNPTNEEKIRRVLEIEEDDTNGSKAEK